MNRRRLFGLAGGAAATVAVPAIAAPVMEMHENDVKPYLTVRLRQQIVDWEPTSIFKVGDRVRVGDTLYVIQGSFSG